MKLYQQVSVYVLNISMGESNMKKEFITPTIELTFFEAAEIICASGLHQNALSFSLNEQPSDSITGESPVISVDNLN